MQFSLLDFDIEQTYAGTQALHQTLKEKAKNLENLCNTLSAVFRSRFQLKLRLLFLFLHGGSSLQQKSRALIPQQGVSCLVIH